MKQDNVPTQLHEGGMMDDDARQKAVQSAGEKLDRLIEVMEENNTISRQIRRALVWLVFLAIPINIVSCSRKGDPEGQTFVLIGMVIVFAVFLAFHYVIPYADRLKRGL